MQFGYLEERRAKPTNATSITNNGTNTNTTTKGSNRILSQEVLNTSPYSATELSQAITDFQAFTNLKTTGTVTPETETAMKSARCGVRDKDPRASISYSAAFAFHKRARRYVVEGSKWSKTTIRYCITQPSSQLTLLDQKLLMESAFRRWAEIFPLVFRWTDDPKTSDINIRFASGNFSLQFYINTVIIEHWQNKIGTTPFLGGKRPFKYKRPAMETHHINLLSCSLAHVND